MIDFKKIEIITSDGVREMTACGEDKYCADEACVVIGRDGEVCVTAEKTAVYSIVCTADNTFFTDALVLGDAWERAYGDLRWEKPRADKVYPWYFVAYGKDKTCCFGVETLPDALCSWQCDEHNIILNVDIRNGTEPITLCGRRLKACRIITAEYPCGPFEALCDFCRRMCPNPRIVERPVFGGNDWYCCYGDNSYEKIMLHTKRIAECAQGLAYKPYMVIDDGWEICHHEKGNGYENYNGGPWRYANSNFRDMKKTAGDIQKNGAVPGIWFRPLLTAEKFPDRYYLKNDGIKYVLDPSVPEVLRHISEDINCIKDWGYKLIKHDFSTFDIFGKWGFELESTQNISFFDKTRTTAEIIKSFYKAIRTAAGDDVLLIGCNTMSHLSAGIFDIQRTGDDTSGNDWERTKKYGINTLAFRLPQHKIFYLADADCVGITNNIPWQKNRQWLDVLAKSGTPLFVSIAEDAYNEEIK